MLIFNACTPPGDVGAEVLPDDDLIAGQFSDTFSIRMNTLVVDSLDSYQTRTTFLGNYVDPELGHVFGESYFQPRISGANVVFSDTPQNLVLDSVVLSLDLDGFYGRFDSPLELEVLEIMEEFPEDISSQTQLAVGNYDYANGATIDFRGQTGFLDFINIRLDDSLGRKLLFAPSDSLLNNDVFTEYFKGILVRTKPVDQTLSREAGGIFYIDATDIQTSITLFYNDGGEQQSYAFDVTSTSDYFYRTQRTDVGGRILDMVTDPNQDFSTVPYTAIQSGAVIKTFVQIPGLDAIRGQNIARAQLFLPVDTSFFGGDERFEPPSSVVVYLANESGTAERDLNTVLVTASYNEADQRYALTLTNSVANILADRLPNDGFIIVPTETAVRLNRAVLAGPGHPFLEPEFRVVYTTIPGGG